MAPAVIHIILLDNIWHANYFVSMDFTDKHIYAIFTAQHLLKNHLVKMLREKGVKITPAHATILFLLETTSPQTMSELSQVLHLDNSTVTGLIDRLEKSGFVARTAHPGDRRIWEISITPKGIKEIAKAREVINKVNKEIERGLTKDEIAALHTALGSFKDKFS